MPHRGFAFKKLLNLYKLEEGYVCNLYSYLEKLEFAKTYNARIWNKSWQDFEEIFLRAYQSFIIKQQSLNLCMISHVHKDDTNMLDFQAVTNDFVSHNSHCHTVFGTFV